MVINLCCQHQTSSGEILYRNVISWSYVRPESEAYKNLLLKRGYDIPVEILKEIDIREQRYSAENTGFFVSQKLNRKPEICYCDQWHLCLIEGS